MSVQGIMGANGAHIDPFAGEDVDTAEAAETTNADMMPSPAMQELMASGDAGAQIAAMMMMMSKTQRQSARETRRGAEKAEGAAQQNELEAMRNAADERLDGARNEAILKGFGGACTIASAGADANGDKAGTGALKGANEASFALAGYARASGDHEAAGLDVEAKAEANAASTAKREIDDARDAEKDAKDLMNRVMSFYKEYATAKEDASKAALHRA